MASFLAKTKGLWNAWELRSLVLISLLIRTLLILLASVRKHTTSRRISFLIWSFYLLADWFATFALGVLAKSLMTNNNSSKVTDVGDESAGIGEDELKAFWAPFLLLHLGGTDNITAFSLEDNELWLRHLVGLLFQSGTAIYIFISSLPEPRLSWAITVLMLIGGISKYIERILALVNASRDRFRKSMMTRPADQSRDSESHARKPKHPFEDDDQELILKAHDFFQIFKRLIVDLILTFKDQKESRSFFTNTSWEKAYKVIEIELGLLYEILYTKAAVVRTWKGWILRFTTIFSITAVSIIFFGFTEKQPFDKIDVAITFVLLSGAISLELWSLARLLFTDWTVAWMMKKKNFFNPSITRFVAKVVSSERPLNYKARWSNSMAQYNLIKFCIEDQPSFLGKVREWIQVKDVFDKHWYKTNKEISNELKKYIFEELRNEKVAWSSPDSPPHFGTSRGQLALQRINIDEEAHHDQLALRTINIEEDHDQLALRTISIEEDHDQLALLTISIEEDHDQMALRTISIEEDHDQLALLTISIEEDHDQMALRTISIEEDHHQSALWMTNIEEEEEGNQEDDKKILEDSIKAEFDESILLWHIATDICYYMDGQKDQSKTVLSDQRKSRDISNYMLYLLVSRPSMLPTGIGQIRFGDTCAEAQRFLHQGGRRETKEEQACKRLHELNIRVSTKEVEGDHTSNSVLLEASNLAKSLLRKVPNIEKRWNIISLVWLEILCYAASECRGYFHAQRLSAGGGELLTIVCFVMAHLGKGKQYRLHRGHARDRLIVKNNV